MPPDPKTYGVSRRRRRRRGRRVLAWVAVLLVLVLAGGGAAAYRTGRLADWLGDEPAPATAPVTGFRAPASSSTPAVLRPAPSREPAAAAVRRALAGPLKDPQLYDLRAVVAPLTGSPLFGHGAGTSMPASTLKLLTATTALEVLGPDHTFTTKVVAGGRSGGVARVVLVGGGDPFLAGATPTRGPQRHDASLQSLARRTAAALHARGTDTVRLAYDTSLFSGPRVNPHWPGTYLPDVVSPITALWADEGLNPDGYGRVSDPPLTAASVFATYLRQDGIDVASQIAQAKAHPHARELADVTSIPVADIVERVLQYSDNEGAEVLAHQAGLATQGRASYAAGVRAVRQTLSGLGVDLAHAVLWDGSGLSRDDRLDATTLVQVLQLAASPSHPELRSVISGLPVAAYDGSLGTRFDGTAGRGLVRAKTGTLRGTSALAGLTTDARGRVLVFAFVSNQVPAEDADAAETALDRLASALASCRC